MTLIERLRELQTDLGIDGYIESANTMLDAADRIEQLEAALKEVRKIADEAKVSLIETGTCDDQLGRLHERINEVLGGNT